MLHDAFEWGYSALCIAKLMTWLFSENLYPLLPNHQIATDWEMYSFALDTHMYVSTRDHNYIPLMHFTTTLCPASQVIQLRIYRRWKYDLYLS